MEGTLAGYLGGMDAKRVGLAGYQNVGIVTVNGRVKDVTKKTLK